jgi:hypothetical protein
MDINIEAIASLRESDVNSLQMVYRDGMVAVIPVKSTLKGDTEVISNGRAIRTLAGGASNIK